ncbi:MAG: VWA domain-containing protein, partial [Bacteroidia bacterium]|nr:VWA domain-containing protein [Bacteroidia bacterium]
MKNQFKFPKLNKLGATKFLIVLSLLFSVNTLFGQEIILDKYSVQNPDNCAQYDITVEVTGNPPERPQEVILIIDRSGSMDDGPTPEPIDYAKDAAIEFVQNFFQPANNPTGLNRVGIVSYGNTATLDVSLSDSANQGMIIQAINNIVTGGYTNIEDALEVADQEMTSKATFDCATSRSMILLSDGVATRYNDGNSTPICSGTIPDTPCQTEAIAAGIAAQTTDIGGTIYDQSIFTIGLIGAISGLEETIALNTLDAIQNSGAYSTEVNADLTAIYDQILGQLVPAATQLPDEALVTSYIGTGFSFVPGSIDPTKGTATHNASKIAWYVEDVFNETITLTYSVIANEGTCGIQQTQDSEILYIDSMCTEQQTEFEKEDICVPCPTIEPDIEWVACTESVEYSSNFDPGDCASVAENFLWEFFLNGTPVGTSTLLDGVY